MTKTEYAEYLQSEHWLAFRKEILTDRSECERCELPRWLAEIAYDQDLHLHHKHYRSLGKESGEDVEVLCARCHELEEFSSTQFREVKKRVCRCGRCVWNTYRPSCEFCEFLFGFPSDEASSILDYLRLDLQYPDKPFAASFDWFITGENIQRVNEGYVDVPALWARLLFDIHMFLGPTEPFRSGDDDDAILTTATDKILDQLTYIDQNRKEQRRKHLQEREVNSSL